MPTKDIFTRRHSNSLTVIDPNPVIALAISPFEEDLAFLQRMFNDVGWMLFMARSCREAKGELERDGLAVIICEWNLIDGTWRDVLGSTALRVNRPRVIVVSRLANAELWTEVLNLGGFDLLPAPLREVEVGFSAGSAWLDWTEERRHQHERSNAICIRKE